MEGIMYLWKAFPKKKKKKYFGISITFKFIQS